MAEKTVKKWWHDGVRFECQGSGKCCVSRGEYGHVYLTLDDRRRLARLLKMRLSSFTRKFCEQGEGIWKLKDFTETCVFLEDKRCKVYTARPTQCRTWPFWPEVMSAKAWSKDVAQFCPGVGKGKVWGKAEIEKRIKDQMTSEEQWGK